MRKKLIGVIALTFAINFGNGQYQNFDKIQVSSHNTILLRQRFAVLYNQAMYYFHEGLQDSVYAISKKLIDCAIATGEDSLEALSLKMMGNYLRLRCDYVNALKYYVEGIKQCKHKVPVNSVLAMLYNNSANIYNLIGNHEKALFYLHKAQSLIPKIHTYDHITPVYICETLAETYYLKNQFDSSICYLNIAYALNNNVLREDYIGLAIMSFYGDIYAKIGRGDSAEYFFQKAIQLSVYLHDSKHMAAIYIDYSSYLLGLHKYHAAKVFALKGFRLSVKYNFLENIINAAALLRVIYDAEDDTKHAYLYFVLQKHLRDSIYNEAMLDNFYKIVSLQAQYEQQKEAEENARIEKEERNHEYKVISISVGAFIVGFLLWSFITMNTKLIAFSVSAAMLVGFEYINFSLAPTLDFIDHQSLYLNFIVLVMLAAFLIPAHHHLENYVKNWNEKRIRNKQKKNIYKPKKFKK